MSYAVMPLADYKAACDKLREKTETTELIKSGELPQKIDEVYQEGQLSVFLSSEVLQGKTEGNPISITDVSPVEHDLSVKLSSDTLTDFSSVKVTACGKNLFDVSKITNTDYITNNGDGSITIKDGATSRRLNQRLCELCPTLKVGDVVTFGAVSSTEGAPRISIGVIWNFGTSKTITENYLNNYVYLYCDNSVEEHTISNIQIAYGKTATEYEPFVESAEYSSNSDGVVNGVKRIYPSMSLSSDAEVTISAEYFKDIDKVLGEGAS